MQVKGIVSGPRTYVSFEDNVESVESTAEAIITIMCSMFGISNDDFTLTVLDQQGNLHQYR